MVLPHSTTVQPMLVGETSFIIFNPIYIINLIILNFTKFLYIYIYINHVEGHPLELAIIKNHKPVLTCIINHFQPSLIIIDHH